MNEWDKLNLDDVGMFVTEFMSKVLMLTQNHSFFLNLTKKFSVHVVYFNSHVVLGDIGYKDVLLERQ